MICQECGAEVEPAEYHPMMYCAMVKAGFDPKVLEREIVKRFVGRVNRRAEQKMAQTGKLEGSHYAAMQIELAAIKTEADNAMPSL